MLSEHVSNANGPPTPDPLPEDSDMIPVVVPALPRENTRARNLPWGAIVLGLFAVSVATNFLGLIVIFPLLGHATWHAYRALRPDERQSGEAERMFISPA